MSKEKIVSGYYQPNITTARYENSTYTTKYAIDKLQQEIKQLKEVIEEVREYIVFCINGMKNEFACTDSRTNRELHTMVKILEDRLQILDKVKEESKYKLPFDNEVQEGLDSLNIRGE